MSDFSSELTSLESPLDSISTFKPTAKIPEIKILFITQSNLAVHLKKGADAEHLGGESVFQFIGRPLVMHAHLPVAKQQIVALFTCPANVTGAVGS
ncbi:hypothetical protein [Planctomycetes bacterium CA13]|uniref:hypothetical protein n=1 Tax=Novipirellula herctigrandis TaxID=2527986 RepID=UPI0011B5E7CC